MVFQVILVKKIESSGGTPPPSAPVYIMEVMCGLLEIYISIDRLQPN